ncbi:prion-inhibition and propagation-domain-containing protein [Thelonectria olida]|uniref:Prion-inhibition and propagation-domain-containing protein n=1 Tax=Thelonectria olida TaxID=1576542 RepID=A0A9P8VNV3_9HYPO|nr:prion-inhibition and propagation-domain-containing protein [Thelonectria olida]
MADPLSITGLALGSASILFQVFAGVVQGIELMVDVKEVPEEYANLRLQLQLEEGRLLSWGHAFGFVKNNADDESSVRITIPDPVRYMVQGKLEPLWDRILKFTAETPSFTRQPESNQTLGSGGRFKLKLVFSDLRFKGLKLKAQIKWATFEMGKLKDLVDCARHVNDSLISLSELKTQREIYDMVQSTWMGLLDVQDTVGGLKELIEALSVNNTPGLSHMQTENLLRDLAQLKKRKLQAQSDADGATSAGDESSLKLAAKKVVVKGPEESAGLRWEAVVDDKAGYWLEFKPYPRPSDPSRPTKDELERLVVCELAMLLHLKLPPSFRVPRCIGYYDEGGAFGLVFEKTNQKASLVSLSCCLRRKIPQPDLGTRLALARAVAETVYQLHAVDWLHKALRAGNILLFEETGASIAYAEPCVSGFDLARPVSQPNLTQEAYPGGIDDDFYRHPHNQLCNPSHRKYPYHKDFDLYSLGIVLIEIALWSPIKTAIGDEGASEPSQVKECILNESKEVMSKVRFAMGTGFAKAVLVCLQGLGSQVQTESYAVSFERLVLKRIRGVAVMLSE